ncbi:MAG: PAS domain S-box protein [bacterium]
MNGPDEGSVRILLVEDESLIAEDIKSVLKQLGYSVLPAVSSGEEAVRKAEELKPDLILMDILLSGEMDGVTATEIIRSRSDIPIIYLTAHADEGTLERAKKTEPYGYILKPFHDQELKSVIDTAMYKHGIEKRLKESEERYRTTLHSIGDAVIATDAKGRIALLNSVAEALIGWKNEEACGKPLEEVFRIVNEETRQRVENPVERVLRDGLVVGLANHSLLIARDGKEYPVADSGAPIRNAQGEITGVVLVFRDQTEEREAQKALFRANKEWQNIFQAIGQPAVVLDKEHRITAANRVTLEATGKSEEELVGLKCYEIFHGKDRDRPPDGCPLEKMLRSGKMETVEMEMEAFDGTYLVSCTPVLDEEGNLEKVIHIATDITERKKAEEAVQESEEKYRHLFDSNLAGVYRSTLHGQLLTCNDAFVQIYGYGSREEMLHCPTVELYSSAEDRQNFINHLQEKGSVIAFESEGRRMDGSLVWLLENTALVPDANGQLTEIEGIVVDITEQKRAEAALRESEERFRLSFENANIGMCLVDLNGRLKRVNKQMCKIFGYSKEELERMTVNDIAHPEDIDISPTFIRKASSGEVENTEFEKRYIHKQGHVVWGLVTSSLVRDSEGTPQYFISHVQDITVRKQAEEALKESEEKYRNLVERANDGIVIVQDGIVKYINPRLAEMWNSSVEEIIGTPFIDHLSPDERPTLVERYKQRMAGEDVPPVYEAVLRRKDGSIVYSELNAGVIVYQGKPADLVMVRDITERIRAEEKIRASLEEKNVMLKEIHHRVRNNLQVIKSLLSLQSRYVKDTQALEMLKESQERIQSMAMVHEKLYESEDLARIDFVDYVTSLTRGLYRSHRVDPERIALKIKAAEAVPLGIDLAVPCGIVVNELVTNALKHAFPPSWKKKGLIQISLKSVGEDEVEVVVKDNGTGLPEGVDFHDADTLGFRLVKILVEDQLRGKLSVERDAGTKLQIKFKKV